MFTGLLPVGTVCVGFLTGPALTLGSMMSRTLRILLAGMVAVVFASAALSSATADEPRASDQSQVVLDRHEVAPEDARPGGGAAPFDTGVVIVVNTLLLGALVGGVLFARRRMGCAVGALPRLSA